MKDYVVYSVLTGNYDDIRQPVVVDDRFDYILFSNDINESDVGIWSVRTIPCVVHNDNKRLSRYPKTHPESLLAEYKASFYIDANIQILDQWVYDRFIELFEEGIEYAGVKLVLTGRDCIYEHAFDMCLWLVEHEHMAIKQCHALYKLGFPRHFGLNENNIIFRIHTDRIRKVDEEWWNWIKNYSHRDQLSYMYCLWKNEIALYYFLPEGEDARNSQHFRLVNHDERMSVIKTKIIKLTPIQRVRLASMRFDKEKSLRRWLSICQSNHPILLMHWKGALTILENIPNLIKKAFKD